MDVAGRDGVADELHGLPVEHWHLLMQEGMKWQQLGLPDAGQPWPLPLPWQRPPFGGGDLLLEQGQSKARVESDQEKQGQVDQARPRAWLSTCHPLL